MVDDGLLVGEKRSFPVESGWVSVFTPGLSFCRFYLCSPYPLLKNQWSSACSSIPKRGLTCILGSQRFVLVEEHVCVLTVMNFTLLDTDMPPSACVSL